MYKSGNYFKNTLYYYKKSIYSGDIFEIDFKSQLSNVFHVCFLGYEVVLRYGGL